MRNVGDNLPVQRDQLAQSAPNVPTHERTKHKGSHRARQLWDRLSDWYGVRFADTFGDEPSRDWAMIVDNTTPQEIVAVLTLVRRRHVTFPPTLPEFAALVKEVRAARAPGPQQSTAGLLTEFVLKHRTLTPQQMLTGAWTYLHRQTSDGGYICTGVEIAGVDGAPAIRVMVDDMNAEQCDL